jgi:hypothetical protein
MQLGLVMAAMKTHKLFCSSSIGIDVNVVMPKRLQPSTVFARCDQDSKFSCILAAAFHARDQLTLDNPPHVSRLKLRASSPSPSGDSIYLFLHHRGF